MRKIPMRLRMELKRDQFYRRCVFDCPDCQGKVEWEHALLYKGQQVNTRFAIIPCCTYHHRGEGLNKQKNMWVALNRMVDKDFQTFWKAEAMWRQLRNYLNKLYGEYREPTVYR